MTTKNPEFIMITGPMMASKTTTLFLYIQKAIHRRQRVAIFKPDIDGRYDVDSIATHDGLKMSALKIKTGSDILEFILENEEKYDVIAVDEAFMIPKIAQTLKFLYMHGHTIIVSSLNLSAQCKVFKEIEYMLPWATKVEKLRSVCCVCGEDADFTYKKVGSFNDEIEIGGADIYEPRCFKCHPMINERDK